MELFQRNNHNSNVMETVAEKSFSNTSKHMSRFYEQKRKKVKSLHYTGITKTL